MDDGLLAAAVLAGWGTVAGGLVLAIRWVMAGGGRAPGPDDDDSSALDPLEERVRKRGWGTGISVAHIGTHGVLAVATVAFLTWGAVVETGQRTAVLAGALVSLVVVAVLGLLLYQRYHAASKVPETSTEQRPVVPEHALPRSVVIVHGLAALATLALVVAALTAV